MQRGGRVAHSLLRFLQSRDGIDFVRLHVGDVGLDELAVRPGLEIYRRLTTQAALVVRRGGRLLMELGYRSLEEVREMLSNSWVDIEVVAESLVWMAERCAYAFFLTEGRPQSEVIEPLTPVGAVQVSIALAAPVAIVSAGGVGAGGGGATVPEAVVKAVTPWGVPRPVGPS